MAIPSLTVALVAFPAARLGRGVTFLILRRAPTDIVAFAEVAFVITPDVSFVGTSIDQFAGHFSLLSVS
jgi:hypothetical protein